MEPTPPASSTGDVTDVGRAGGSRQMRLKVSYCFDDQSKANCLARWPHLVNTPVVQLDQDTLVGAVEFKTCILSIIAASPELVATLGQDYSVYAYDYSEPGIPLVGCGMLSWAMLNTNDTSTRIMITGRVNPNKFGFFNNDGIKETLEVKLKLQEVHTFTQEQFVSSVHVYSAIAKSLPGNFDASAWSNFIQAHPDIVTSQPEGLLSLIRPAARSQPAPIVRPVRQNTEPLSNASEWQPPLNEQWADRSTATADESDRPPKKKARVAAKRQNKASANGNSRKRVKGSTTVAVGSVPAGPGPAMSPPVVAGSGTNIPAARLPIPALQADTRFSRESSALLPIATAGSDISPSPQNLNAIASSPPPQAEDTPLNNGIISPAPTSPVLPALPAPLHESSLDPILETAETPPVKAEPQSEVTRTDDIQEHDGLFLPSLPRPQTNTFLAPVPEDAPLAAVPSTTVSQAKSKAKPARRFSKKAVTSQLTSDTAMASSELADDNLPKSEGNISEKPRRSRTAIHAKERIQKQLLEAIERGQMPSYCQNCGAIETPVWRRVKVLNEAIKEGPQEQELLLCNPCGLWYSSRKYMRPREFWDGKKTKPANPSKPRKRKKSVVASEPSPAETEEYKLSEPPPPMEKRGLAMTPSAHRSAQNMNSEWDAAIAASRRAAKSSPVIGSADSPIEIDGVVDGQDSPRRVLFGTARKDKQVVKNSIAKSARDDVEVFDGPSDKENDIPDGRNISGPATPVKNTPPSRQPQTPMRSASKVALLSSSPWKTLIFASGKSGVKTSTSGGSPTTPERRLLKSDQQRMQLSPTANLLERLLEENNSNLDCDPCTLEDICALPGMAAFDLDDVEFWGGGVNTDTDMTMPSSPPGHFNLFEDPDGSMSDRDGVRDEGGQWDEFLPSSSGAFDMSDILDGSSSGQDGGAKGLTVDLSAAIEEASKT